MKKRIFSSFLLLLMMLSLLSSFPITAGAASTLKSSANLIQVVKDMEGFKNKPYWDNGHWAIGYGTTCPDELVDTYNKNGITVAQAEEMLKKELTRFETAVNTFADKHGLTLKQQQFDALVSFTYNCGEAWMYESTGYFYNAVREKAYGNDFLYAIALFSGAAGSYPLIKRRLSEANMYLNGVYKAYNTSNAIPSNYKYVYLDGNGGDVRYVICAFDANQKGALNVEFKDIPTGKDSSGKTFAYTLAGWYTAEGKQVTALDSSLKNGQILYAKWKTPEGKVQELPKGKAENLTVTVTGDAINVRKGPGTFYDKVTTYAVGTKVTIKQTYAVGDYLWGQTDKGWFLLDYSDYETQKAAQIKFPRKGFVTTDNVNVRTGPGTEYSRVTQMDKGEAVTIHEVRQGGTLQWGRLDSGNWICMDYVMYADEGSTVKSISVSKLPNQVEYIQEQEYLKLAGSVLLVTYHDGSTAAMTLTRSMVSGFSNTTPGKITIQVSYEDCKTSFQVTIVPKAHSHSYTKAVATEAFLATKATCTAQATYYYSCECGAKGDKTFTSGATAPHTYEQEVTTDAFLATAATCTTQATYYYSCVCGVKGAETFSFGDLQAHTYEQEVTTDVYLATAATCTKPATYYYSCACGAKGTETFSAGTTAPHTYDKAVATDAFLATAATCTTQATYYYSCKCGAKGTETFAYGGLHNFNCCVEDARYFVNGASCKMLETYYYSCVCGAKGTETFTVGDYLPHRYEDQVCNDCGARLGDIDEDGVISTDDVVLLLLYISMPDMFPLGGTTVDFDGNGLVTVDDAVKLLLHISMPDIFPI